MWLKNFDTVEKGWLEIDKIICHFLHIAHQTLMVQPQGWSNQISAEQNIVGNYLPDMADRMHELGSDESRDQVQELYQMIRGLDINNVEVLDQITSTYSRCRPKSRSG